MEKTGLEAKQPHSRRIFFKKAFEKTSEIAIEEVERKVKKISSYFVRPPGVGTEIEFLDSCTSCGDCVSACQYGTIFLLEPKLGLAMNTPALDLIHKACHLCEDFPCITACKPQALKPIKLENLKFSKITINTSTCIPFLGPECGVCEMICTVPGAIKLNLTTPEINPDVCNGCAMCREACPVIPSAILISPLDPAG